MKTLNQYISIPDDAKEAGVVLQIVLDAASNACKDLNKCLSTSQTVDVKIKECKVLCVILEAMKLSGDLVSRINDGIEVSKDET